MPDPRGAALDADGPAAPPRRNGELVFEAPWESRIFGMALALRERGVFDWEDFRAHLIAEIATWERTHGEGAPYHYYERFQAALERLLTERGLCAAAELDSRADTLAARPPGHDHEH